MVELVNNRDIQGLGGKQVRVAPANENVRKHIQHPSVPIPFGDLDSLEWPNDQFTKRRLRDGDVTLVGAEGEQQEGEQSQGGGGEGRQSSRSGRRGQSSEPSE